MTTIQDIFENQAFPHREEYADLFAQILEAKDQYEDEALAQALASIIENYQAQPLTQGAFPKSEAQEYSRSYIGRDGSGWESIVCRWEKGAQSSVHGHPDVVFYYVLEGKIEMPFYDKNEDGIVSLTRTEILEPGDFVFSHVPDSKFENMIHGVNALEPSLSLHIFSGDALKGEVYTV